MSFLIAVRAAFVTVCCCSLLACSGSSGTPATAPGIWVTAWGAAMQNPDASLAMSGASSQTFRTIVRPTVGSRGLVRLHFSNLRGMAPVTLAAVGIAVSPTGNATIDASTETGVTFGGTATVTIPAGAVVTSDPTYLRFAYGTLLAVTSYVAGSTATLPQHSAFEQIATYATASGAGDRLADAAGSAFVPSSEVDLLDRVDLYGDYTGTVAFAGSSTTAGFGTPVGSYSGIVDDLANSLHAAGRDDLALANMSIIPDSLLLVDDVNGNPSVSERLSTDFLALPGIRTIVQNAADVDLKGGTCAAATTIIAGDRQLIARARAVNVRVVLAVIAPSTFCNGQNPSGYGSRFPAGSGQDGQRDLLNAWIVATSPVTIAGVLEAPPGADGVADVATVVEDPANTGYLLPAYDIGDDSHVDAAGQLLQAEQLPVGDL